MKKIKTREEWLLTATEKLRPIIKKHGASIPKKIMVGCGWPKGGKVEVIGQCFGKTWTSDKTTHIFISPTQGGNLEVLAILVHELIHAAVGTEEGHKGRFKSVARAIGLEGKLTHTTVSKKSPLYPILETISKSLGIYPHSKMMPKTNPKHAKFRWIRLYSSTISNYSLVISPKSLKLYGYPRDPKGKMMVA